MQTPVSILIMAGGKGERFWPRSRADLPKQFLRLRGAGTLLQETFRRARCLVQADRVFVVTPAAYRGLILGQLPELPPDNLILEPLGRDTAPCIGLGAVCMEQRDPEAVMIVLPADHAIGDEPRFLSVLAAAARTAAGGEHLVTIGITPTRPETGYGYIQCGEALAVEGGRQVLAVRRFAEKPALEQALAFFASREYLWNSGMFAWKVSTIRRMISIHLPWLDEGLERIAAARRSGVEGVVEREFAAFPSISIDRGLLERAANVVVVPGDFGWDDVGSWASLERVHAPDDQGNVIDGLVLALDTRESILCTRPGELSASAPDRLVVTYGVRGLLVVDTPDVLLVADKGRSADLKQVVGELRRRGLDRYLSTEGAAQ